MHRPESPDGRPKRQRLLSVDFWRGLALLTIFINHVPGNVFVHLTHRNYGFSDATEIFVMLAGVAAALAYLPRFREGKALATSFRILQRAFQLYMAHIVLIVFSGAIIAYTVNRTGDSRFLEAFRLDILINDTIGGLIGLATLSLQPSYLDILPLYIVLVVAAPLLLLLARCSMGLTVAASVGLYVVAQFVPLHLVTFPASGLWFLNPFCWQLLFVIGLAIGRMILDGRSVPRSRVLLAAALAYLAIAAAWIVSGFVPSWNLAPLPVFLWEFNKTDLFLPRLLHVLALSYVATYLPTEHWLRSVAWLRPFAVLGRHSLPVFALGTVLAINGQMMRALHGGSLVMDVVLIGSGVLLLFACAGVLEWNRLGQADRRIGSGAVQPR
ncbi:OpgC family protein [Terrihabitans sp. B22-R8]|uniref:OpgC family protein n=1 Tax=Terrihabitans sp. B22-R8 TaxID=3425128 RepID=UPI00403D2DB3